jgi:hypothetical protein
MSPPVIVAHRWMLFGTAIFHLSGVYSMGRERQSMKSAQ